MAHASRYDVSRPVRFRRRAANSPESGFGPEMTAAEALSIDGPLYGQAPGSITRWMAVPWQTDTASCRSGYAANTLGPKFDPYLPSFWPARVPNHVLTFADYQKSLDTSLSEEARVDAFSRRASWFRQLGTDYRQGLDIMVREFHKMPIVEAHPGLQNDQVVPALLQVEEQNAGGTAPLRFGLIVVNVAEPVQSAAVRHTRPARQWPNGKRAKHNYRRYREDQKVSTRRVAPFSANSAFDAMLVILRLRPAGSAAAITARAAGMDVVMLGPRPFPSSVRARPCLLRRRPL